MQTVVATAAFDRAAARAGMDEDEVMAATVEIAADPVAGAIIQGTGGCRKRRLARKGTGKSGGYRIVWWFGGDDIPVFVLTVLAKGDKENLSKAECNALKKLTASLRNAHGGD